MTASISSPPGRRASLRRPLPAGFGPLFRKDLREWAHSKRIWVILAVTTAVHGPDRRQRRDQHLVIANVPDADGRPHGPISLDPLVNFLRAVASQIFVIVAIFAVDEPARRRARARDPRLGRVEAGLARRDLAVQVGSPRHRPVRSSPGSSRWRSTFAPSSTSSTASAGDRADAAPRGRRCRGLDRVHGRGRPRGLDRRLEPGRRRGDRVRRALPAARSSPASCRSTSRRSCRPRSWPGPSAWRRGRRRLRDPDRLGGLDHRAGGLAIRRMDRLEF